MAQPRLAAGRHMVLPAVVALLGVSLSIGGFVRMEVDARGESIQELTEFGNELLEYAEHVTNDAVEHAQATKGLFEASEEVTAEEFEHFFEAISSGHVDVDHRDGVTYAPRVAAADLEMFLADVRVAFPSFSILDIDLGPVPAEAGRVYWPVLYSSAKGVVGFKRGFDLGSRPPILLAIESSMYSREPTASPFLSLGGDDQVGDLVIVAVIRRRDVPVGLAVATLQLDELLVEYAVQELGSDVKVELSQDVDVGGQADVALEDRWVGHTTVVGQPVTIILDNHQLVTGTRSGGWVLVLGTAVSFLLGWMMSGRTRRNAMRRRLKTLETTITEKDNFLASVSHAIRTPMTAIVGALEILNDQRIPVEKEIRANLLRDARISALDLEHVTENYLTGARVVSGTFTVKSTVVDLDTLMSRVLDTLDIPERVVVTVEPLGKCRGDLLRVHQIIRNLLRNANQHAVSSISVRVRTSQPFVVLQFINDGPPVPTEAIDKMFISLERGVVPGQPDSVGLGLSVSRGLARMMGGDLTYRHEDGRVIFEVALAPDLPLADTMHPKRASSAA